MPARPGDPEQVDGVEGLTQATHAGDVGDAHEHEIVGALDRRQGVLVEAGTGVDDDIGELGDQEVDDVADALRRDVVGLGREVGPDQGVEP